MSEWISIAHAFAETRKKFGWSRAQTKRNMETARIAGLLGEMRGDKHEWPDGRVEYKNIKMRADALLRFWQRVDDYNDQGRRTG